MAIQTKKTLLILIALILASILIQQYIYDFISPMGLIGKCSYKQTEYIKLSNKYSEKVIIEKANAIGYRTRVLKNPININIDFPGIEYSSISLIGPNRTHPNNWVIFVQIHDCTYPTAILNIRLKKIFIDLGIESEWLKFNTLKPNYTLSFF